MHFSPERRCAGEPGGELSAVRCSAGVGGARPEWSVASDAEGGSAERGGPSRLHQSRSGKAPPHQGPWWTSKGRGRRSRSSPDDASASKASGGQRELWLSCGKHRNAVRSAARRGVASNGRANSPELTGGAAAREHPRAFGCLDRLFAMSVDDYYRVELQCASY